MVGHDFHHGSLWKLQWSLGDGRSELKCSIESGSSTNYVQWEESFQKAVKGTFSSLQSRVCIFRCAGIYDNTKSALHTLWKQRQQQEKEKETTKVKTKSDARAVVEFKTNRIHVTDIAQAVVNSIMEKEADSKDDDDDDDKSASSTFEIYNLSDDLPERRSKVMEYASDLLTQKLGESWRKVKEDSAIKKDDDRSDGTISGTTKDGTTTLATTEAAKTIAPTTTETKSMRRRRREQEPKLIDNQKLKRTLLPQLLYPTYKEGLDAILLDPQAPWNNFEKQGDEREEG